MIPALLLAVLAQSPQTWEAPGSSPPYALSVQGITGGTALPVTGSLSVQGAADTVGASQTYTANSQCANVATAGQAGAGFVLQSGTLAATLTPSVSTDSTNGVNGTWTATSFVDISGNKSSTLVLTNPNSAQAYGLVLEAGVRYAKVCTTAFTSGNASGNLVASTPQPPPPAAGADVTDRAARLLGQLTDGSAAITPTKTGQLPTALDGSGFLKTHEQGTAAISASSLPLPTGASTAAKQPALGTAGTASSDVLTVQGITSMTPLKTDGSGVTQPVSGTVTANQGGTWTVQPGNTANTTAWKVDGSAVTQPVSGTVAATQSGSWSLAANQSVNVAQINGVTALMGNGTTGTGSQRVTIASDNTAFAVKPGDGTNTVTVKAASTAPATTDTALVVTESPQVADQCPNTLAISQTTSTDILTTTAKLHVCSLMLVASAALVVNLVEGTGTVCATGGAALIGSTTTANGMSLAANGGFSMVAGRPWLKSKTAADHICLTMSGTGTVSGVMTYADQ